MLTWEAERKGRRREGEEGGGGGGDGVVRRYATCRWVKAVSGYTKRHCPDKVKTVDLTNTKTSYILGNASLGEPERIADYIKVHV